MDLWVVAAAAGAGYIAKYWQNFSSRENEGLSDSFSGFSIRGQSKSQNLLHRLAQSGKEQLSQDSVLDGKLSDTNWNFDDKDAGIASTSGNEGVSFQGIGVEIDGKSEFSDEIGGLLSDFKVGKSGSFGRLAIIRDLRSSSYGYFVKPVSSSESFLTTQLHKEHARMEEYLYSPLTTLSKIGSFEVPKKLEQNSGRRQNRRLSSSSTMLSGEPFHSQGSGMLPFSLGITIGIMSSVIANKKELEKLNELLRQTQKLAQDLHEELEMKDLLTVKQLTEENSDEHILQGTPSPFSNEGKLDKSAEFDGGEPDDQNAENSKTLSKIEAELEAELQMLELNMNTSSLERISDFVELDPDFEADVVQGDLKLDNVNAQSGCLSNSDNDATCSSTDHTYTANFSVSPRELSLRLHEVIRSRLQARIIDLETQLENMQHREFNSEVEHSSAQKRQTDIDEGNDIDQPVAINFPRKALDAYSNAYGETAKMSNTDEEALRDTIYNSDINEERWVKNLVPEKLRTWEEQTSRSCGSNEIGESDADDDEIGKLLIKQILEKTRQGSPLVLNAKRMLYSMDDK